MIRHHPTEALLMAYAAGTLPEAMELAIATHISLCDTCRAAYGGYDAVGGALLDRSDSADLSDGCLTRTLARIRTETPEPRRQSGSAGALPAPLAGYVGESLEAVSWRPVGMGVRQAVIATTGEATARLFHIPAGTAMPDHGHNGTELTLVLQGAFSDAGGTYARGDIEVATEADDHMPVADISADCICLAVTDAPLRFKGWLPRLAQRFVGI
ncbi:ChrR family anti-sigma-E factor [Roseivivax sediminis]|uniref:Anti-ECFsigma factor, ChrR n=1 Tax=Roseivivax sediminis TaxID=936889 RepID=A0A1I1ZZJ7_9RHOB|nr:ChrR family anti-sigma-E factor [Roseivivax sediminis]SFE37071.1 anti-ECFsigma factor, ChrR [Roseivivax sediminis]